MSAQIYCIDATETCFCKRGSAYHDFFWLNQPFLGNWGRGVYGGSKPFLLMRLNCCVNSAWLSLQPGLIEVITLVMPGNAFGFGRLGLAFSSLDIALLVQRLPGDESVRQILRGRLY